MSSLKFCKHPGCPNLVKGGYCEDHQSEAEKPKDRHRGGTATERGYNARWHKYAKQFLSRPENQICKLHLDGCTILAECVDHITPPAGPDDPLFWDASNHQAACIHCNSKKGHTVKVGHFNL